MRLFVQSLSTSVLLIPVLFPAILMRGRSSAPKWYIVSAVGFVSAFIPIIDASDDSGGFWALPWDTLWVWLFVTVPIWTLGMGMLVARVVAFAFARLRRPERPGGARDDGFDPFDDGEPQ